MENINVIAIVNNARIMDYLSIEGIFIFLYLFAMIVLIIRINQGIKQRKLIEILNETIKNQEELIKWKQ